MNSIREILPSEAAGPAILAIILVAALGLAARTKARPRPEAIVTAAGVTLALQALHVAEEFIAGFHKRLPPLVGLAPWSDSFFVSFNLAWIAIWALAIACLPQAKWPLASRAVLIFLALAACGNAISHPLLSLATSGYFPGTLSALALGPAGFVLASRLLRLNAAG